MRLLIAFGILSLLFTSFLHAQQIYKWKDEKGQWHFSQTPPASNIQRVEQRSMPQSKPQAFPKEVACAPFKVGETRRFTEYTPSPDFPHLQLADFEVRLADANKEAATFSYKLVIKNTSRDRDGVQGSFSLMECDGFSLAEQTIAPRAIPANDEVTISGSKIIYGSTGLKIGRFVVSLKGLPKPKPDVRVYSTQLQEANSEIYFVGEVHNVGTAAARNVKVSFTIKDERDLEVSKQIVETSPPNLKPGQSGIFRKRIFNISTPKGYGWFSKAEWSE